MAPAKRSSPSKKTAKLIETRITKAPSFVSIHADGIWGGLTPKALIAMGFFTEQFAAPDKVMYSVPDVLPGQLTEVSRQGGGYVQREIVAQVFITIDVARTMVKWLEERIETGTAIEKELRARIVEDDSDETIGTPYLIAERP